MNEKIIDKINSTYPQNDPNSTIWRSPRNDYYITIKNISIKDRSIITLEIYNILGTKLDTIYTVDYNISELCFYIADYNYNHSGNNPMMYTLDYGDYNSPHIFSFEFNNENYIFKINKYNYQNETMTNILNTTLSEFEYRCLCFNILYIICDEDPYSIMDEDCAEYLIDYLQCNNVEEFNNSFVPDTDIAD